MRCVCPSIRFLIVLGFLVSQPSHLSHAEDANLQSPAELWHEYDPEALPLDITSIRTWTEESGTFEALRFTAEIVDGVPVRVFAIRGAPRDTSQRPGILHIHGGGQTASLDWVRFWVKRGYVGVTFDFCGPWAERAEVTDWGSLKHANMQHAAGGLQVHPTPRHSSWYHWTIASRRALTLLAKHPQVDSDRLGIFGISVGGTLTWMVAGSDKRVKAAAPIYGCGYNYDRRNVEWGQPPTSEDLNVFQRVLSAEAHAPYVTCPILFFDATNDFHGLMDRAFDTLNVVPAKVRQTFTPRVNHHISPDEGRNLPLWMDWHLNGGKPFPDSPALSIKLDQQGVSKGIVQVSDTGEVENVDLFYAMGNKRPNARFWRRAPAERQESGWVASLPVMDSWDDLRAVANVTYRSGIRLTTNLKHVIPAQLGKASASLKWHSSIAHGTDGLDHWYFTNGYTDPMLDWEYLRKGHDPVVGPGIGFEVERFGDPIDVRLSTHLIGDPQSRGRDGHLLSLTCRGDFSAEGLKLILIEDDWGLHSRRYTARIDASELGAAWSELKLPLNRFVSSDGHSPANWKVIDKLEIEAKAPRRDPPQFARLRWIVQDEAKD